jgi:hypothetical protein
VPPEAAEGEMNTLRATWYDLCADWWAILALGAVYFFGPANPVTDAAIRLYEQAEDRVAPGLPR